MDNTRRTIQSQLNRKYIQGCHGTPIENTLTCFCCYRIFGNWCQLMCLHVSYCCCIDLATEDEPVSQSDGF